MSPLGQMLWLDGFAVNFQIQAETVEWFVNDPTSPVNAFVKTCVDLVLLLVAGVGVVDDDFDGVLEDQLHEPFRNRGRIVHGGRAVNFDQPAVEIIVDHDVVTKQLEHLTFVRTFKHVLHALKRIDHNRLDFFKAPQIAFSLCLGVCIGVVGVYFFNTNRPAKIFS